MKAGKINCNKWHRTIKITKGTSVKKKFYLIKRYYLTRTIAKRFVRNELLERVQIPRHMNFNNWST